MKYWLFEHGDVVGPFTADELSGREGFGPHSLVCPEERGDDDTFWKEAESYEEFAPAAAPAPVPEPQETPSAEPVEKKDVFDEELDTLLSEKNPLGETETPAGEPAEKVHFPPHEPAKSGPIEDYFNNIQGGDLGNILGIPDPNENSDMNLARALEKQFKETQPPLPAPEPVQIESGPFDEFTAKEDLDDLTPDDGLAAVAPMSDSGAPVVLAEKPLPEDEKPKVRLRKKQETVNGAGTEKNQNNPQELSAQTAPSADAETHVVEPASFHAGKAQEESSLGAPAPAEQAPAPETADSLADPQPQPLAQENTSLTEEPPSAAPDTLPETQTLPPAAADGAAEERKTAQAEEQEPPAEQTESAAPQTAPQPQDAPEPETEEMNSIPLSVTQEPLALSLKNPDGLKETSEAEPSAKPQNEEKVSAPENVPQTPAQEKPVLTVEEPAAPSAEAIQGTQAPAEKEEQPAETPEQPNAKPPVQAPAPQDPVEEIMSGAVEVETAPEVPEPIKQVAPVVEPQVNRVKTTLKKTPEIEQFLTEKILPVDEPPAHRNKSVLWAAGFLVLLLAVGGVLLLLKPAAPQPENAPAPQPITQSGGAVEELMPEASAQPDVPSAQEALSLAPSAKVAPAAPELNPADAARQIVQNYELPNFNGKVADYFDRIYKDKLAQGYSATWSAERLHNNVYIVKYRLSKTRSEPVVYIFQVDVSRNKLTGALNNITLDLVGKIK